MLQLFTCGLRMCACESSAVYVNNMTKEVVYIWDRCIFRGAKGAEKRCQKISKHKGKLVETFIVHESECFIVVSVACIVCENLNQSIRFYSRHLISCDFRHIN